MDYGKVTYTDAEGQEQEVSLRLGSMTIGSAPENDIVISDESVARIHVRLLCTPDGCWATDLASPTGTFLNQVRLKPSIRHPLRNGDALLVGNVTVRYSILQASFGPTLPAVLPPEIAARLPVAPPVRRLRGNGRPLSARELPRPEDVSSYLQYLPPCYHDDVFLGRFLLIFESILGPIDRSIDHVDFYFDPRLAPEALLPWLASWFGIVLNEKWSVEQRRTLIHSASELYRWRGTRRGLREYLRIYTGVEPVIVEPEQEQQAGDGSALPPNVFRVVLDLPDPDAIDQELVEAIIEAEKPAHTSYVLEIRHQDGESA